MDDRLPSFPSAADEALLRDHDAWPIDDDRRVRDPASGRRLLWWRVVELLQRDDARAHGATHATAA